MLIYISVFLLILITTLKLSKVEANMAINEKQEGFKITVPQERYWQSVPEPMRGSVAFDYPKEELVYEEENLLKVFDPNV